MCDDLNRMVRNYFWGAENGKRKTHWYAWKKMTLPKKQGGLGFKDFRLFNQALLARQALRIIEYPNSLCARLVKAKYFPNGKFVDTDFTGNPLSLMVWSSSKWELCGGLGMGKVYAFGGIG